MFAVTNQVVPPPVTRATDEPVTPPPGTVAKLATVRPVTASVKVTLNCTEEALEGFAPSIAIEAVGAAGVGRTE